MGSLKVELGLKVAKGLPETTVAMVQVARAEHREDVLRTRGEDDYSIPFDRLMDAFDSFISERSNRKKMAGYVENYDLSKPRDLTILLLWQIRHIRTHAGGLIGEFQGAKERYEKYFKAGNERGIKPVIYLPEILKPGLEVTFSFEDYKVIKKTIFDYIAERIPKSDVDVLQGRSTIVDITTKQVMIVLEIQNGWLMEISLVDLFDNGVSLDLKLGKLNFPSPVKYFSSMNMICFASTGVCIPVRLIPPSNKKYKRRKT